MNMPWEYGDERAEDSYEPQVVAATISPATAKTMIPQSPMTV